MTCQDCIHFDVCKVLRYGDITNCDSDYCGGYFKPKSRFVELPCEVGQTLYFIGVLSQQIVPSKAMSILYNNGGFHILCENGLVITVAEQLGKTVFLDPAKAEKALAERSK